MTKIQQVDSMVVTWWMVDFLVVHIIQYFLKFNRSSFIVKMYFNMLQYQLREYFFLSRLHCSIMLPCSSDNS